MKATILLILAGMIMQSPAAVFLSGAGSIEEMDQQTAELFERLGRHPLQLNQASRSTLQASGLFTPYQLASLLEYRSRSGDILSYTELGRLDGWSEDFAQALREFTTLDSKAAPGQSSTRGGFRGDATLRYGSGQYLGKLEMGWGQRCDIFLSSKESVQYNASFAYYGKRRLGKVVIGSYNARFGQGLVKWSGMTMSGFNTVEALSRRASGISLSTSTSPSDRGIAMDFDFGNWTLSGAGSLALSDKRLSIDATVNLSRCSSAGEFGITGQFRSGGQSLSADFRVRAGHADLFGELACELPGVAPAAILGIRMDPGYGNSWSVAARYYSPRYSGKSAAAPRTSSKTSDETGISAAFKSKWLDGSLDCCFHPSKHSLQFKALLHFAPRFNAGSLIFLPSVRISERYKPGDALPFRTDLRCELGIEHSIWRVNVRWNGLRCKDFAWLAYLEAGCKAENFSVWTRGSIFRVDNWDDRIYVYERDVPGNFNVPACYGRGCRISLTASWKSRYRPGKVVHGIYLRTAGTFFSNEKPATFEWRVQYSFKW